jgi:hypothetical protein
MNKPVKYLLLLAITLGVVACQSHLTPKANIIEPYACCGDRTGTGTGTVK